MAESWTYLQNRDRCRMSRPRNMTLEHLQKAAAKACKDLRRAEAKAEELQRDVQTAQALTKRAPLKRKQPFECLKRACTRGSRCGGAGARPASRMGTGTTTSRQGDAQNRKSSRLQRHSFAVRNRQTSQDRSPTRTQNRPVGASIPLVCESRGCRARPAMKHTYDRLLSDEELRPHLERGDTVLFKAMPKAWHEIERQVERLGYGDDYAVSRTTKSGPGPAQDVTRVSPLRGRSDR